MTKKSAKTLAKQAFYKIKEAEDEIEFLREQRHKIDNRIVNLNKELARQRKVLKENSDPGLVVSEHALIRYMERHIGLDIEKMKNLVKNFSQPYMGAGVYPIKDTNCRAIVENNILVTIYEETEKKEGVKASKHEVGHRKEKASRPHKQSGEKGSATAEAGL